jgi:putative ABC transport system permease protein
VTGKIVLENLKHRPLRSLLSTLLIGLSVALILTLVGLSFGMSEDSQRRQKGSGADIIVRGPDASSVLSASSASIPQKMVAKLEEQPHVKAALGIMNKSIEFPLVAAGVDLEQLKKFNGGFTYIAGGAFQGPYDVLIDPNYANQKHVHVGDEIKLFSPPAPKFRVCGIIAEGNLARVAVPLTTLQDRSADDKLTQILLRVDDPALIDQTVEQLHQLLPNYPINSMSDYIALFGLSKVPGVTPFLSVMIGVGVVSGFLSVGLSMYMAVLQRTREIGILKSIGASKGFVIAIIELEAMMLGIAGAAVGIVVSLGAKALIHAVVPASLPVVVKPEWWPIAAAVALVAAALGALYPGLSAATHDPIEALSYE